MLLKAVAQKATISGLLLISVLFHRLKQHGLHRHQERCRYPPAAQLQLYANELNVPHVKGLVRDLETHHLDWCVKQ